MAAPKHASAPWGASTCLFTKKAWAELNDGKNPLTIVRANWDGYTGEVVAVVWGDSDEEEHASATLIATAPELLDAANTLQTLRALHAASPTRDAAYAVSRASAALDAAIAQAEGRS